MILAVAFAFVACGDSATKSLVKELGSSYDKDGQQVEFVGYFSVPRNIFTMTDNVSLSLHSVAGQSTDAVLVKSIELPFGRVPNGFYVPEKYSGSDVEIYDSNGEKHGYLTEFKVTGIVHYTKKDWEKVLTEEFEPSPGMPAAAQVMSRNSYEARQKREQENVEKRKAEQNGDPNDYSYEIELVSLTAL